MLPLDIHNDSARNLKSLIIRIILAIYKKSLLTLRKKERTVFYDIAIDFGF